MAREGRRWRRYVALGVAGLVGLVGIVLLVWRVPPALYAYVDEEKDRAAAEASTRTGLIAGLAGLAALGSLAIATRTYRLTQQGQITDRYTKAIEQLGTDKLDVTLGGLYALERIAKDSPADLATIAEVLTAYVRAHAPWQPPAPGQHVGGTPLDHLPSLEERCPDVQAAMTVLARMSTGDRGVLHLQRTDLRKANLAAVHLKQVSFGSAHLEGAVLFGADLQRTVLSHAHLKGAMADGATRWPAGFDWEAAGVQMTAGVVFDDLSPAARPRRRRSPAKRPPSS
jgi:Pentapeptide repeats (8 copies)